LSRVEYLLLRAGSIVFHGKNTTALSLILSTALKHRPHAGRSGTFDAHSGGSHHLHVMHAWHCGCYRWQCETPGLGMDMFKETVT